MSNAHELFKRINTYADIQRLIGTQETLYLDFKRSASTDGSLTKEDNKNFKKALSGFAHQEGGIIVWGIDCRKRKDTGIDEAIAEVPIPNPGEFATRLLDMVPNVTDPIVDGYDHKIVFVDDEPTNLTGFVVSLIPKSYKVHRIISTGEHQFYKRYGSSFKPVETTEEIRALFFRQITPTLELTWHSPDIGKVGTPRLLSVKNTGMVMARHIHIHVNILPFWIGQIYDATQNEAWKIWTHQRYGHTMHSFFLNGDRVLHPNQEMIVFYARDNGTTYTTHLKLPNQLEYELYAENMEPRKGILEIIQK